VSYGFPLNDSVLRAAPHPALRAPFSRKREKGARRKAHLPQAGYGIHTSLTGGHIGPSPSSRYAAAPLRFARFARTNASRSP